jgi:hypothetical protein
MAVAKRELKTDRVAGHHPGLWRDGTARGSRARHVTEAQAETILNTVLDAGINYIDRTGRPRNGSAAISGIGVAEYYTPANTVALSGRCRCHASRQTLDEQGALRGSGDPHGQRQPLRSRRLHLDSPYRQSAARGARDRIGLGPGESTAGPNLRALLRRLKAERHGPRLLARGMLESFTQHKTMTVSLNTLRRQ